MDPAVAAARRVVGLYGDPTISWSIALGASFSSPLDPQQIRRAVHDLYAEWPDLGIEPEVRLVADVTSPALRAELFDQPYGDDDPLLRVALRPESGQILLAAHHGAVDGLGLLGALARIAERDLVSSATGIEADAEPAGFWLRGLSRVAEAIWRPPLRLAPARRRFAADGDWAEADGVLGARVGTAALLAGFGDVASSWPGRTGGRPLANVALSRRPGTPTPPPNRSTAYSRVPATQTSVAGARRLLHETPPEPAFPETTGAGIGPVVTRALASRLGATALLSNLGVVSGADLVEMEFWPAAAGPAGVAVGFATVAQTGRLTVRCRRGWFDQAQARHLVEQLAERLQRADQTQ